MDGADSGTSCHLNRADFIYILVDVWTTPRVLALASYSPPLFRLHNVDDMAEAPVAGRDITVQKLDPSSELVALSDRLSSVQVYLIHEYHGPLHSTKE